MKIRNHRSSSNSTCMKPPASFQTLIMASPHAYASPPPEPYAQTSPTCQNLHHQQCPQSCSQALSVFDVTRKSLDKMKADVGCSNRVVAASELQEALQPIGASKPLLSNGNTATTMGNESTDKFRVCTVNMSPWDVPSFLEAFDRDSTPSHDHNNNPKMKMKITVVNENKHSNAKHCWKPNKPANTAYELNKLETLRSLDRLETIAAKTKFKRKDKFAKLEAEEVIIESALKKVLSECGGGGLGLTVRQAACRVLLFDKYDDSDNNNSSRSSNNDNRKLCGGLPLSVVVRRVMLNSPYFVELNHGRFALWADFIKKRTLPDHTGSQKLNLETHENSCNEHDKVEIQKAVVSSSPLCLDKTKRKRSSRKLGLTREECNMEPIPQKTDITMKNSNSAADECRHFDQTKHRKKESDEDCKGRCEKKEEEERRRARLVAQERGVEVIGVMACGGERKRGQSCSQKRKAVKARSLKALAEIF